MQSALSPTIRRKGISMLLQNVFLNSIKRFGDKTAIIDRSAGKQFSYTQTGAIARSLSAALPATDSPYIGICIPTSAGCTFAIAAVLLAGKIPVMINYATGADKNTLHAQKTCGFSTVITSRGLLNKLDMQPVQGMLFLEDLFSTLTEPEAAQEIFTGDENDTAVILFTSGSEKKPKCVQLTHKNISSNIAAVQQHLEITSDDLFASVLPFYHSFGLTVNLWLPLYSGATACTHTSPLEFGAVVQTVRECKATVLMGTSSFFRGYLKKAQPGDFASCRIMVAGAEKLRPEVRSEYQKAHSVAILEGYGCTETSPVVSVNQPWNNTPGSIGTLIPGVSVKITDPETGEDLGRDREGKILVKGDLVMKGYLGDEKATTSVVHDGWYDTGDMGVYDSNGKLWHRGRLKRFIKIAGEMVSLIAIEDALDGILPEGVQACMAAVPDAGKGAKLVAAHTGSIHRECIQKHLSETLGNLMVPGIFHQLEEMPVLGTGKIDFKKVESLCCEIYGS